MKPAISLKSDSDTFLKLPLMGASELINKFSQQLLGTAKWRVTVSGELRAYCNLETCVVVRQSNIK